MGHRPEVILTLHRARGTADARTATAVHGRAADMLPVPDDDIPLSQIIDFRLRNADERQRLVKSVEDLLASLRLATAPASASVAPSLDVAICTGWIERSTGRASVCESLWKTAVVRIPGYVDGFVPVVPDDILVDRTDLIGDPVFWALFLMSTGGADSAAAAFDVDPADMSALYDDLDDPDRWPVFTLPVRGGHRVHLVWCNYPDDSSHDYLLSPSDDRPAVPLAHLSGHFHGPGLSWDELVATSQQPDPTLGAAARLLLLLPASGDIATPPTAYDLVAAALTAVGARRHQRAVATELLTHRHYWTPADWHTTSGLSWCSGSHTYRTRDNPDVRLFTTAFS